MLNIKIKSIGTYIPKTTVTSGELEKTHNIPKGWIEKSTGIKTRRYINFEDENMITAGAGAAREALKNANCKIEEVDCIISASASKYRPIPCTASFMLKELSGDNLPTACFDIDSTCLSFVVALDMMSYAIAAGRYKNVLIISSECCSCGINWNQKESAALIGDAAAAALISADDASKILYAKIETFTNGIEYATVRGGLMMLNPLQYNGENKEDYLFDMNGRSIYKIASNVLPSFINQAFTETGLTMDDIKMFIPHQASMLSMKLMQHKLGIPEGKMKYIIQDYGNSVATSIPLALKIAIDEGEIKRGDKVMLLGTSAGLSVGVMILEY